ncbi:MAG: radical SAM protein [Myxococcales bacterium]|nr:radical SAM protein [Myxococcales bacterium]
MRIDLIFPPFDYSVLMPELGIPLLTANLRRAGFEVRQADWNIEFIVRELGRLSTLTRLVDRFPPAPADEWRAAAQDPTRFLARFAGVLGGLAAAGADRRPASPSVRRTGAGGSTVDPFDAIRAVERRTQKSCHLRPHQIEEDWRAAYERLPDGLRNPCESRPAVLSGLARWGARDPDFRARLLRLLQHLHFAPASYRVEDVLAAADRPDPLLDPFYDTRLQTLFAAGAPQIFGVAIWSPLQLAPALRLARVVRSLLPRAVVVAGGAWCTYAAPQLGELPELFDRFDAVLPGEADAALATLAAAMAAGRTSGGVPGVVDRSAARAGRVVPPAPRPLETIAPPEYDGLPLESYPERKLVLRLSRGCYWGRCTICSHVLPETNRRFASRKDARLTRGHLRMLAEHVRQMRRCHGIRHFTTADNLVPPGILRQLCELRRAERLDFTWDSLARFDRAYDLAFCRTLAAGGCRRLDLGLEVADDAELRRIRKGLRLETALRTLRNLHRAGVGVMVFVVDYPGLPPETLERTLEWLAEHRDLVPAVSVSRFHLACGTRAWRAPGSLGLRPAAGRERDLNVFDQRFESPGALDERRFVAVVRRYADRLPLGGFAYGGPGE